MNPSSHIQKNHSPSFSVDSWKKWKEKQVEFKGEYDNDYPCSSKYFSKLMNKPFIEKRSDLIDKTIFDFFIAIESKNLELVKKRFKLIKKFNQKNHDIILKVGHIISKELNFKTVSEFIKISMTEKTILPKNIEKNLESKTLEILRKDNGKLDTDNKEKKGWKSTLLKVGLVGLILVTGFVAPFFFTKNTSNQKLLPYDYGKDSLGVPFSACDQKQYWPIHEKLITEKILSCPAVKKLSDELNRESSLYELPNWNLKIVESEICALADSKIRTNTILISCNNFNPSSYAIFELINLSKSKKFLETINKVITGEIKDRDSFAYAQEQAEYFTAIKHIRVVNECMKEKKWDKAVGLYDHVSWDVWWKKVPDHHKEKYRRAFDTIIRNFEEVKNIILNDKRINLKHQKK